MFGLLMYLIFIAIGFFITYLIIKTAVKHAIMESLYDIQITIKQSIDASLSECDWNKSNKN